MAKAKFTEDVELDARMVLAAMRGGFDGLMLWAMRNHRDQFSGPDDVVRRAEWTKAQPASYMDRVVARVVELEKGTA